MTTHDPSEYIRQLQQILVSDKKKIAFLFGAGTSLMDKYKNPLIPAIDELTSKIEEELTNYQITISQIKPELDPYNIETLLSNLEQKLQIIGNNKIDGLDRDSVQEFIGCLKQKIKQKVSIHDGVNIDKLAHVDFAEWIGRANRKYPVEIFTTNYDFLFELGLEGKNIPFYDGFTGSYVPFFNSESVEDMNFIPIQTKLWKIHGSLGWHYDEQSKKICRKILDDDQDILIYPSMLKYDESRKQPYIALLDRLSNFLKQPDTVLITCGYSFGDQHINERILTALNKDTSGHVIALFYDIKMNGKQKQYSLIEKHQLTNFAKTNRKLSVYGCKNAVIGGQFGQWKLKREPDKMDTLTVNLYFDEDAPCNLDDNKEEEKKGNEIWTGEGDLIIPDFAKFIEFLQSMILKDEFYGSTSL